MKTSDILEMDPQQIENLSRGEVAKLVATLASTARKRIARGNIAKQQGVNIKTTITIKNEEKGLDVFTTGKTKKQLLKQFRDLKYFLQLKTSTITGYKKHQEFIEKRFKDLTKEQYDKIMNIYNKAVNENIMAEKFKYQIYDYLKEEILTKGDIDEFMIDKIIDKVYDWYEEYEPEQNDIFEWDN